MRGRNRDKKKKGKKKQLTTIVGEEVFRMNLWSVW